IELRDWRAFYVTRRNSSCRQDGFLATAPGWGDAPDGLVDRRHGLLHSLSPRIDSPQQLQRRDHRGAAGLWAASLERRFQRSRNLALLVEQRENRRRSANHRAATGHIYRVVAIAHQHFFLERARVRLSNFVYLASSGHNLRLDAVARPEHGLDQHVAQKNSAAGRTQLRYLYVLGHYLGTCHDPWCFDQGHAYDAGLSPYGRFPRRGEPHVRRKLAHHSDPHYRAGDDAGDCRGVSPERDSHFQQL